jgi:hypothetical protein
MKLVAELSKTGGGGAALARCLSSASTRAAIAQYPLGRRRTTPFSKPADPDRRSLLYPRLPGVRRRSLLPS